MSDISLLQRSAVARSNAASDSLLGYTENGTSVISGSNSNDKDIFMKLLVAQMSNLDPFAQDQDPTKYITQMAQFSTLEQLQSLNSAMNNLAVINNGLLVNSAVSMASELLGKECEFITTSTDGNSNNKVETSNGVVQSVYIEDGLVYMDVKLENGETKAFPYESFVKVSI